MKIDYPELVKLLLIEVKTLQGRAEALEWFVECYDACQWVNRGGWYRYAIREAQSSLVAARAAVGEP